MPAEPAAVSCRAVVQVYASSSGPVHALKGLTIEVPRGVVSAIVGPSGAGKSTLLRLLAGLERATVGEVRLGGRPFSALPDRARRRMAAAEVGYVFQVPTDNLIEDLTVRDHVEVAARMRRRRVRTDVGGLLDSLDLGAVAGNRPADLGVGDQQRLAFAMAVAGDPAVVVADEPTASLDPASSAHLVDRLRLLAAEGRTMVISSHDPAVIAAADQVLVLRDGMLAMEARASGERFVAIDEVARLALPPEAAALFPAHRARLRVEGSAVHLEAP